VYTAHAAPQQEAAVLHTTVTDEIRALNRRTELLAPAGRWDVLEAVMDAGADAVYVSGKRFQMRAHRKDFHFDDAGLRDAVRFVHGRGRRLYVTVNTLLAEHELADMRRYLAFLAELRIDAAIVCDMAVPAMAREMQVPFELHASTMMNIHDAGQACRLVALGIQRIVTSRDISMDEAGRIGDACGAGIEYFLHGDMCVAQSGQCSLSGLLFGKSSNRGECMKPCRWHYGLETDGREGDSLREGHLMAIRDLSLIRQIPDLVAAGICALKIEGRMRDAAYLAELVRLYREATDRYYACPAGFAMPAEELQKLFRLRVRELSALCASGAPSSSTFFDISGRREPLFLSDGAVEADMRDPGYEFPERDMPVPSAPMAVPELAVCVASEEAAAAAMNGGASRIYLAAETAQYGNQQWTADSIAKTAALARERGIPLGVRTPRIASAQSRANWAPLRALLGERPPEFILVHHLGALERARKHFPQSRVIADYGFNILNSRAARVLLEQGVAQVTPGPEASLEDIEAMIAADSIPLELPAHGPLEGMVMNHCLIAMHLGKGHAKDVCRGICRHSEFFLRDRKGERRAIVADQFCRNHILTAKDLALLPVLEPFLNL
jgi:putative protease